ADIHLSDDGRFLYASNRLKEDGISVFSVGEGGLLTKVGYTLTGVHPRNFTLSDDGRYVLVAVRDSDRVEVYSRDAETGLLTATGQSLELSHPVFLMWM
ncbi:MAG: beta-propeller fold lactonase family protein, partial [Alistipes sp.]|nr:beta-propeller fold lactonase family protein [Alistipes sp.]